MIESLMVLALALVVVYFAADMFTNALEHMGERIGVSEGVTGSLFAAVGTAMPETIVPVVAILAGGAAESVNREVGLGAIIGAPFMLATLSIGMMATAAGLKRGWLQPMTPEPSGLERDLRTFIFAFLVVIVAALLPDTWSEAKIIFSSLLFVTYFFYVLKTINASRSLVDQGHATEADDPLTLARFLGDATAVVILQLLIGLLLLVGGAKLFVHGVEAASEILQVSPLIVSLLIVPVATELPEKINSILWIRKGRDTLAFGNVTGAMVFQGTIIPGIGMLLMPWNLHDSHAALAVVLALAGNLMLLLLFRKEMIKPLYLSGNMLLYAIFVAYVVFG